MYLIDRHGFFLLIVFLSVLDPGGIFPFIIRDICNSGCCARTFLCCIGIWVCFIQMFTVGSHNKKFIKLADLRSRHKYFINTDRSDLLHRICFFIPVIKLSDHRYRPGIRCPYCKIYTLSTAICNRMSSQFLIYFIIGPLAK